jgi:hypothetical protein
LRQASHVLAISDGLRDFLAARYPALACQTLPHSLHEEVPAMDECPAAGTPLRVAFLGTLNESNADAMQRLAAVLVQSRDCQLTIYSGMPEHVFRQLGILGPQVSVTSAAPHEVTAALRRHDVLYLPHGLRGGLSAAEYQTIFPTRTVAYLFAGRPILAHVPAGAFLTQWLREHECAEIVQRPDAGLLHAALERLRRDEARRTLLVRSAAAASRQFQADVVAARFRELVHLADEPQRTMRPEHAPRLAAAATQVDAS